MEHTNYYQFTEFAFHRLKEFSDTLGLLDELTNITYEDMLILSRDKLTTERAYVNALTVWDLIPALNDKLILESKEGEYEEFAQNGGEYIINLIINPGTDGMENFTRIHIPDFVMEAVYNMNTITGLFSHGWLEEFDPTDEILGYIKDRFGFHTAGPLFNTRVLDETLRRWVEDLESIEDTHQELDELTDEGFICYVISNILCIGNG